MGVKQLKPHIKLTIENPKSGEGAAFGPGIAALCQGVRDTGSLNASAKQMHMAYSKAWRVIRETEEALGFSLLDRDGAHGSTLTKNGAKLLDAYQKLQADIQKRAEDTYKKLL
ncbi:MAG: LysR family transcriptional regulator [Eggerthellaceae bacterium]|nr:LysR family transcriptional regulator [Eggerthellaceae bacterium]